MANGSDIFVPTLASPKPATGGSFMNQHYPSDTLQADLERLNAEFEAEDREDRRVEAQRRCQGLPKPERDIKTFPGFADGGTAPRT